MGTSISERPEHIDQREEFGQWEIDTVIGKKNKHEPVLLTITERVTRHELIFKIPGKTAGAVQSVISHMINTYKKDFSNIFKSITCDNSSEFAEISSIEKITKSSIYFDRPYSSGERGTNEKHNGLIRRFLPKGRSFNEFSDELIMRIQNWCNDLPRKILGYLTPKELFEEYLAKI